MSDKIDKPSDVEFARAIVQNIPAPGKHGALKGAVVGYLVGKAIKNASKKR